MEEVFMKMENQVCLFAEEAQKLFKANKWTWMLDMGNCIPNSKMIEGQLLSLISTARMEFARHGSAWITVSAGRLTVRTTGFDGNLHGSISVEPVSFKV